jgi:hypothetical protein
MVNTATLDAKVTPLVRKEVQGEVKMVRQKLTEEDRGHLTFEDRPDVSLMDMGTAPALSGGRQFELKSDVPQSDTKIPRQVILTGAHNNFWEVMQSRGSILAELGISPDMHVRYFNNFACRKYLKRHFSFMVEYFDKEDNGSYRGDICRTAVIAKEGGFYIDLDMQLRTPLESLVDDSTTFMSARSATFGCLNAIIASVPNNPVMLHTLENMRKWYSGEASQMGQLGTATMQRGLGEVMSAECPQVLWQEAVQQFECGPRNSIRLFTEQLISHGDCSTWGSVLCPKSRAKSDWEGVRFGLFDGKHMVLDDIKEPTPIQIAKTEQMFVGWSRFDDCAGLGCGLSGGKHA